jgi:hypothetical protein
MALMQEETVEHAKLRALSQILIDKSKGIEAFEEYMKVAFPYLETVKLRDKENMKKVLADWIAQGPLGVRPTTANVKPRINRTQSAPPKGRSAAETRQLYQRLRDVRERT